MASTSRRTAAKEALVGEVDMVVVLGGDGTLLSVADCIANRADAIDRGRRAVELAAAVIGDDDRGRPDIHGAPGIGVNSYLWRASLDTVSFMPLSSADPFGGVIITDWYTPPESPSERFKMNVYILGRQLRADSVRVAVFRQEQGGENAWQDSTIKSDTSVALENQILTRARQLRIASAANNK